MTAVYSEPRHQILRDVAVGKPGIDVTAPPVIDKMFAEQLLEQRYGIIRLTDQGAAVYREWEMAKAAEKLPGATVRYRGTKAWKCTSRTPVTGWHVAIYPPHGEPRTVKVDGPSGREYMGDLRRANPGARIESSPIYNPLHFPDCPGDIPAGEPYVDLGHERRLHIRCALARLPATPGGNR